MPKAASIYTTSKTFAKAERIECVHGVLILLSNLNQVDSLYVDTRSQSGEKINFPPASHLTNDRAEHPSR